jgi:hypothetical protein
LRRATGRGGRIRRLGDDAERARKAVTAGIRDALVRIENRRLYYAGSVMLCTPSSLSQEVGLGLGNQVGEKRLTELLTEAGFGHVRRATETPFNLILEVRRVKHPETEDR